ncbi:hypothetical protein VBY68_00265 [Tenacibaculum ascidiaceicola]|nr:hypothetical protein [Tenacibaculum discolor]
MEGMVAPYLVVAHQIELMDFATSVVNLWIMMTVNINLFYSLKQSS